MEQLTPYLITVIKCLAAILAAIFLGNGAVYFFNKMPARWFCDYGEAPPNEASKKTPNGSPEGTSEDPTGSGRRRIRSHPWKIVFTMLFVVLGIWLVIDDWRFAVAALCSAWLLIEMAIGDVLYRIVPDQLILLLGVTAVGYLPYYDNWRFCVFGGLAGFGLMGFVALLGRLIYRRDTVGGGDIKLFAALGFVTGAYGIVAIFVVSTLLSAVHFLFLMAQKKVRRGESRPMVPYIAVAAIAYLAFFWGIPEMMFSL